MAEAQEEALEARTVEIGHAAEAVPAADRNQRFEFHGFRRLGQFQGIRPIDLEHPIDGRDGAAAVEIGAESAELELAVVEDRIGPAAVLPRAYNCIHGIPPGQSCKLSHGEAAVAIAALSCEKYAPRKGSRVCRSSP